ncbi:MAG: hypothetical protein KJT03_09155, partial [Verrucomicrobiae bacterium]|nr:hypothetical protein [Verrucomicrobiae bacterium]
YPDGCLGDIMELIETGFVLADTYDNQNGFFPDGTICHHPRYGIQFTADAYGWEWLVENSIPMARFLKDTRYRAGDALYQTIADSLLDTYRSLTFKGYLDVAVGGLQPDRSKWGPRLLNAVTGLLEARSKDTTLLRETELQAFRSILKNRDYVDDLTLDQPFWNIDCLVHRRPDYFASAKMISTRSRGLERGIDRRSYYYLGDGALFVRTRADAYNGLSERYNWHAIPGTTAEQRLDALPLAADSPFPGANGTNAFAGVVSDGLFGFGAFVYERNHPDEAVNYSTVNGNKAYFFFENEILALGNSIRRVRPGDGQDIWTTLNQDACRTDFVWSGPGDRAETIAWGTSGAERNFSFRDQPLWFYQDNLGYIVLPGSGEVRLSLQAPPKGKEVPLFQLAINHGVNPQDDRYQYVILPHARPEDLEAYATRLAAGTPFTILRNDSEVMAVYHHALKITQAAFFQPGQVTVTAGAEEFNLSVNRPALVMLREVEDRLEVTVTDPYQSTQDTTMVVGIGQNLSGPDCLYEESSGTSRLSFSHSAEALYAGKPVTAMFHLNRSDWRKGP